MTELTHVRGDATDPAVVSFLRGIGREDLLSDEGQVRPIRELPPPVPGPAADRHSPKWRYRLAEAGGAARAALTAIPRHRVRTCMAAVPVALVNAVAFGGQLAFLRAHLHWPGIGQVTMAVALESIAVYLAFQAHVAQLSNDSALRLRLAAYAFAAAIATMNYSHYMAPHWRPTFTAVAIGLMSASSPWLWAVHSRRASRDVLLAKGLIEPHAVRLGSTRWLWHPRRSFQAMWHATWEGITDPAAAIDTASARALPAVHLDALDLASLNARDRLAVAFGALGRVDVPAALALLKERGAPVDQSHAYQVRRALLSETEE
jgi:hypothetical protein